MLKEMKHGHDHRRVTEAYRRFMLRDHVRFVRGAIAIQSHLGKSTVDLLDVGCGDGSFLAALGHRPCVGLDLSEGGVRACLSRGLEAHRGSPEQNPFAATDRRFDEPCTVNARVSGHARVSGPIAEGVVARELIGRRDRPKKEERTVGTFLDPELLVGGAEEAVSELPAKLAPVPAAARADGLGPICVHGQDDIVLAFPHPMRFRRLPSRSLIVAFLLCFTLGTALLTGCSRVEGPVIYDLVEQFDVAEKIVERQPIDFGRPAARAVMREGWFPDDERWNGETPFVWGLGRFSSFDLALVNTRPLTLALEGRPFPAPAR